MKLSLSSILIALALLAQGCAPVPHEYNPTFLFNYKNCDVYKFTTEQGTEAHYSDCKPEESPNTYKFKFEPSEYLEEE